VYDWDCSPYALELALVLAQRLGSELTYVSLTDYVQHAQLGDCVSDAYLAYVDQLVGAYLDAGSTSAWSRDHGMNDKAAADGSPNVRYLADELEGVVRGAQIVLADQRPAVVHHAALGSCAWSTPRPPARRGGGALLAGLRESTTSRAGRAARLLALPRIASRPRRAADRSTVLGRREGEHDPRPSWAGCARTVAARASRAAAASVRGDGAAAHHQADVHDPPAERCDR